VRVLKLFLTDRQIEVLKLRKQGFKQEVVARSLKTTRENVSLIEKRAYENIRRAKATIDFLDELKISGQVMIPPGTPLGEVHKFILARADEMNLHMKVDCVHIQEKVKNKARGKIKRGVVIEPIAVTIVPDGTISIK